MRFLLDSTTDRPDLLGGKARALASLADLPIPRWFVLSPAAFANGELHPAVLPALQTALSQLSPNGEPVAVRSSAHDEDGTQRSFAGQLESFLNVPIAAVPEKIKAVWQSAQSDRVLAYRQWQAERSQLGQSLENVLENKLKDELSDILERENCCSDASPTPIAPAVIIQQMVAAEFAGVAFSADPVTGQRGVVVISAVCGLGEKLVSGAVEGETYRIDRQDNLIDDGLANGFRNGSPNASDNAFDQNPSLLRLDQIQAIADLARRVEQRCQRPQDIEWAIEGDRVYLLQARPITTLAQLPDPDGALIIWDNSNIAESYGGITTPLTFSFARRAYEAVYRQFCRMMGVAETTIAQQDATFASLLGLMQGRIYYNLLNWYRILALLPGFTVNRSFMEQMMGVREALPDDVLASLARANLGDKLRDGLRLGRTAIGLIYNYLTLPRQIRRFYQRLDRALTPIDLSLLRPDELAAYYRDLERQLLTRWDAPLVNDFLAMIFYGVLRKLTVKWGNDTAGTLQNNLISGEGGMISAEPAHLVRQMAQTIAPHPDWIDRLRHGSLSEILAALPQLPLLQAQYHAYLAKFGDRCLEELKLESETLEDNPLLLLRSIGQVASYLTTRHLSQPGDLAIDSSEDSLDHSSSSSQNHLKIHQSLRQQAEAQMQIRLKSHPLRRLIFNWVLGNARARVRDRENLRFERTRLFGRVRRIVLELGKRLYAIDQLGDPRDVFYLELQEILGFIDGTITTPNLRSLVTLRHAQFLTYETLPPPPDRFTTRTTAHPSSSQTLAESVPLAVSRQAGGFQGIGCCPGVVRAQVQIIRDPKQAVLQPGRILVAERTDPGWILLFPAAAGLLVERGSLLSHAAIVSREMGIPAIVSLPGITQQLQDGDWVELNGSTGKVDRILPPAEED